MKKVLALYVPLLLLFFSLAVTRTYAQEPAVTVSSAVQEIDIGQVFTVNITAENWAEPGIWGFELKLYYDTALLDATDAEIPDGHFFDPETSPGIFIVDAGTIDEEDGFVSFALSCLPPEPGKTGSGVIATVTFTGTSDGVSVLNLDDVILVDPAASEIPPANYDISDGEITVIPEFPAALIVPLLVAATLAAALIGKIYRSKRSYPAAIN